MLARVPPSCETARHTPGNGSSAALRAGRARTRADCWESTAADTSVAIPSAACSEVPQPHTTTGRLCVSAAAIASAACTVPAGGLLSSASTRPGWAAIISSITHGGPDRSSGKASVCQSGLLMVGGDHGSRSDNRVDPIPASSSRASAPMAKSADTSRLRVTVPSFLPSDR